MKFTEVQDFFESNRHVPSRKMSFPANCGTLLRSALLAILALLVAGFAGRGAAAQETVLWSFQQNHVDGTSPNGGLVMDSEGNLYGATSTGGANDYGIIFELSPKSGGGWTEKIIYDPQPETGQVAGPGGLVFDTKGNLYGVGGTGIFELSPAAGGTWTYQPIYTPSGLTNPSGLNGGLIIDAAGNLYGTSSGGGTYESYGTVFELSPKSGGGWTETILHSFNDNNVDGWHPLAGLLLDSKGNLYGTTNNGGAHDLGSVYELTPGAGGVWTEKILSSFGGTYNGYYPTGTLIFDEVGNLYATTSSGGTSNTDDFGTVFELSPQANGTWTEQILHGFAENATDAGNPFAGLLFDAKKVNLFGSTLHGGPYYYQVAANTDGAIFELLPQASGGWAEQVLHFFGATATDGFAPNGNLISDAKGNLYGVTTSGGEYGFGTVFEYTPVPTVALPMFSLAEGTYPDTQTVTITDATAGATIYYTLNGTTPTTASTKYTGPITVSTTETIEAIAVLTGDANSPVATATYIIQEPTVATPVISPAGGPTSIYTTPQTVTIADATAGATIYYTTDGTVPTTSSPKYTGPFTVSTKTTVGAIAAETGYLNSAIAGTEYIFQTNVTPPVFSPAAGTYSAAQSVTITDHTAGATIYYTTNGTAPTTASTKYTGPIAVSSTETIEAIGVASALKNSVVSSATYTIGSGTAAAAPTFSVAAGTYAAAQTVALADATTGATIYYTTNGTTPATASTKYTAPITVSATETIEAIAAVAGYTNSAVASAKYTIETPAATPVFSVAAGTYAAAQSVSISDATAGAAIYYTTNGTAPTTASAKYVGVISVAATETLKAIAAAAGYTNSAVASATYTIETPAATPVFSVAAGTYTAVQSVTIADATAGATIYYTTNGTAPTTASTKYTAAIPVTATETLEAIAVAAGHTNSAVASAKYTIVLTAATPVLSAKAGTYESVQTVAITDATAGAAIYYTTNGTAPTTASTKYTTPIAVSASETIKAIAVATGYTASAAASAAYTLVGSPSALSAPATAIATPDATLNAVVNTLGLTGSYLFHYGTSSTVLTSSTAATALTASSAPVAASAKLTTLAAKTTYYFQVVVTTEGGSSSGSTLSFTTN